MKAVLVINKMPTGCIGCPCYYEDRGKCQNTWEEVEDDCTRPSWCPLRPLPSKKDVTVKRFEDIQSYSITEVADKISAKIILKTDEIFAFGWNTCLDSIIGNDCINEITGETE